MASFGQALTAWFLGLGLLLPALAGAAQTDEGAAPELSRQGADSCLRCHDESSAFPVMAIFATPHGQRGDTRSPMAGLQCEACHGPGGEHAARRPPGEERPPMPHFGRHASAPLAEQNQACLGCHQDRTRLHWSGSEHEAGDLSCASCHRIHAGSDPVLERGGQNAVCVDCHRREQAESLLPSAHPLRSNEMNCGDCHAAHGALQPALLKGALPNQVCADCHADKRGPFLWQHPPASEDCGLCHRPHGSAHPALLRQRPPWLCQQCHDQAGHPAVAHSPGAAPSAMLSLRSCANCHSQVHGSNHPSGALLLR